MLTRIKTRTALTTEVSKSPSSKPMRVTANVAAAYDVAVAAVVGPPPTFRLTATPKAATDQVHERCGWLAIDQSGAKTSALGNCW